MDVYCYFYYVAGPAKYNNLHHLPIIDGSSKRQVVQYNIVRQRNT